MNQSLKGSLEDGSEKERLEDFNQLIFLSVIRQVLPLVSRLDDGRLIKKIGAERFKDACDELIGFIETGINSPLTRLEKDALMSKIVLCLKIYMTERMQLAFTIKTLFDCFSLIQVATDEQFPYYHQSKLLKYLINGQPQSNIR